MPFKVLFEIYEAGKIGVHTRTDNRTYAYIQYNQLFKDNPQTKMVRTVTPYDLTGPEKFVWLAYQVRQAQRKYFDLRFSLPKKTANDLKQISLDWEKQLDLRIADGRFYLQAHPKSSPDEDALSFFLTVEAWRKVWKEFFYYKNLKNKDPKIEKQLKKQCFDYEATIDKYIHKSIGL